MITRCPYKRSVKTIVQQTNTVTAKQLFLNFYAGKEISLPAGSDQRSFDFDDQTKIDWDKPLLQESENLIDQHFRRQEFIDALHPTPPVPDPDPEPDPDPDPDPIPAE